MTTSNAVSLHARPIDISTIRKVGIIGAGAIGQALARQFVGAGYSVVLSNRRGPASLTDAVRQLGENASAGTLHDAAAADLVVFSVPWTGIDSVASEVGFLDGRIVIDTTNPVLLPGYRLAELGGRTSSEIVAERLPGARVVKAFNTLLAAVLASNPQQAGGRRVVFISGDDEPAKHVVMELAERLGFAGIDLGSLAVGGALQQFPGGPLPAANLVRF